MSWPNENPTRFHDASLRICPIYQIKIGNHIKFAFTREEMLLFDPSLWHKRYAYVLRAQQDIVPVHLTNDTLMDRPEWGIPIYRNSTWDVLSRQPLDGDPNPVCRVFGPPDALLTEAGLKPIAFPRPTPHGQNEGLRIADAGDDMTLGWGWIQDTTTRHNKVTKVVNGPDVNHSVEFAMAAGGGIFSWEVDDTVLGVTRNIINTANNGFGRELQVALFTQDWNEPPGPTDTGHQNPTQNGTTYGDPRPSQNGLGQANPIFPFTLESLLGSGSPVISFDETEEEDGGTSFDVRCCPMDFQQDRYATEVFRDTNLSLVGETYPVNPILWPTCLFRVKTWVNYKGDDRVAQYVSWVNTKVDFNNYLNANYPFFSACHLSLINDQVGWMNQGYFYDPVSQVLTDISGIADLWSLGNFRSWEVGKDGVYRLNPGPTTRIMDCPFGTHWACFIAESTVDGLCVGMVFAMADNQDAARTQWIQTAVDLRGVATPPPTASPALYIAANTHRLRRDGGPSPKPRPFVPKEYGPYYHYLVFGDLATVQAKVRALYLAGEPL